MRRVYISLYPVDGEVVRTYLESHGVQAVVVNEHTSAFAGTMNVDGVPTVWVINDEDEARALQIIEQRGKHDGDLLAWRCARCAEENDGPFGICWNCGGPAPLLPG